MAKRMVLVTDEYLEMLRQYGAQEKTQETGNTSENQSSGKTADARIIESLPISHRNAGTLLLSFFKDNNILYDDEHRIIIDGKPVADSHVQDLVHDMLRYRRAVSPPPGFEELAHALADLNISREYVKNLARYDYIANIRNVAKENSPVNHDKASEEPHDGKENDPSVNQSTLPRKVTLKSNGMIKKDRKVIRRKKVWASW